LIEIVISLAILSTALLPLVGMISVGLDRMRESGGKVAEARILQAVAAAYQMRTWQEILQQQADGGSDTLHFDVQGTRVPAGDSQQFYTVQATVQAAPILPGDASVNSFIREIVILITDRDDSAAAFQNSAWYTKQQIYVAQRDKP